jgi:hypothetical protein
MSATTTVTPSSLLGGLLQGFGNIIKTQLALLTADEIVAVDPYVENFLNWVKANPNAQPVAFAAQVQLLEAGIIAAQTTVTSEVVNQTASSFQTVWQQAVVAAKAQQAAAAIPAAS